MRNECTSLVVKARDHLADLREKGRISQWMINGVGGNCAGFILHRTGIKGGPVNILMNFWVL
jgi:hypothetical protein